MLDATEELEFFVPALERLSRVLRSQRGVVASGPEAPSWSLQITSTHLRASWAAAIQDFGGVMEDLVQTLQDYRTLTTERSPLSQEQIQSLRKILADHVLLNVLRSLSPNLPENDRRQKIWRMVAVYYSAVARTTYEIGDSLIEFEGADEPLGLRTLAASITQDFREAILTSISSTRVREQALADLDVAMVKLGYPILFTAFCERSFTP